MLLQFFVFSTFLLFIIGIITLFKCYIIVNEGEVIIVERFGKYSSIMAPGFHFLTPFIEEPRYVRWERKIEKNRLIVTDIFNGYRIKTSNICFDVPPISCYSKEKVFLDVNIVVYYNINDVKKAVYNIHDLYSGIETKVETLLVNIIHEMPLDDITSQELTLKMNQFLLHETWQEEWGIKINRFDIQNITLPKELIHTTLTAVTLRRKLESEKLVIESERFKQLSQLESEELMLHKKREIEMNDINHRIKTQKLENEYENTKLIKHIETKNITTKSQQDIDNLIQTSKYKAMKDSGFSENYFIELKRIESIAEVFKAGINGNNKTLILPYESIIREGNHFINKDLFPDSTSTYVSVNK